MIRAEEDAVLGLYEIEFELAGEDETAFNKPGNRFFEIVGRDNVAPAFEQLSYSATRRTVNISVRTDEAATMYYQLELRNTPVPTPSELLEYGTMN